MDLTVMTYQPKSEFLRIIIERGFLADCTDLQVGDLLEFIPGHGCTTVNLHDYLYAMRGGQLVDVWPIAARGKVR